MARLNNARGPIRIAVGSALFDAGLVVMTPVFALLVMGLRPLPYGVREATARIWCRCVLAWLRLTCGIDHRVTGVERLPPGPAVILSKHQSAWETIAFRTIFPARLSWVVKRSLFRIPFYGWALKALEEIGIDRDAGRDALRQLDRDGQRHLQAGHWVAIFPEGTRVPPGEAGTHATGGARLACRAGVPVVPVTLNSGTCWPPGDWRKYPGTIELEIGPPIDTAGHSATEVSRLARRWIEPLEGMAWPRAGDHSEPTEAADGIDWPQWREAEPEESIETAETRRTESPDRDDSGQSHSSKPTDAALQAERDEPSEAGQRKPDQSG